MLASTLTLAALFLGPPDGAVPGRFSLDVEPNHSTIGFSVPIVGGMTRVAGKFTEFSVSIVFDRDDLARCSVEASIKAASIDTGIEARDADLRGRDFFQVEKYPTLQFRSHRIEKRGDGYVAVGELTIRDVTRPLELPFKTTAIRWDQGRPRLGVAAHLELKRLDYGVGADWKHTVVPDFLGNEISIEIFLWTKAGKPWTNPTKP